MTLKYFFSNASSIPGEYGWSMFGIKHLTWLCCIAIFCVYMCIKFKKASYEEQNKILKFFAVLIVLQEILKDVIYILNGGFNLGHLPFHLCGISIFFTIIYAFRENKICGEYIYALSMPGALAAIIFPDWTNIPMLNFSCINSFTIHTWLVVFAFMLLYSRRIRPNFRMLPKLCAIMVVICIPVYFLNKIWGTNFMFLNIPAPGSPLEILYNVFGSLYIPSVIALVIIVWFFMYLPWEVSAYVKDKKAKKII